MISFLNDYSEGAHPEVLRALSEHNFISTPGYGEDPVTEEARSLLRKAADLPDAEIHFLVGGTQTNSACIASLLRPWEGVISAETGHIAQHETGAVEASGHKVLTLPAPEGKLRAEDVREVLAAHRANEIREHTVKPGMIYVSDPTELGTVYTGAELSALHGTAREFGIPLYLDGARLGAALAAKGNDMTLPEIARNVDVFTVGGTKNGMLFGEALVFSTPGFVRDFRYLEKQRGAMLAKGWLLGLQFRTLFADGLYFRLGEKAVRLAERLSAGFRESGYELFVESPTNQVFVLLSDGEARYLRGKYAFEFWEKAGEGKSVYRFVTSFARTEEEIDALLGDAADAKTRSDAQ